MNNEEKAFRDAWYRCFIHKPSKAPSPKDINDEMRQYNSRIHRVHTLPGRLVRLRRELMEANGFRLNHENGRYEPRDQNKKNLI